MTVGFIEEDAPEAMVSVTVTFRGHRTEQLFTAVPLKEAAVLLAAHSDRDPTARHVMWAFRHPGGMASLDLDEVASLSVRAATSRDVKSLWKTVEELST